jgi:Flp pilus assembly protein TadD
MKHYLCPALLLPLCVCGVGLFLGGCAEPAQSTRDGTSRLDTPDRRFEDGPDEVPSAKTLYAMADILAAQGKDAECAAILRTCVRQYPRFMPAYNRLAQVEMRQGRPGEASKVLMLAVDLRPHDPVLLNNLGMSYLVQKEYEKALEHFTNAASLAPDHGKYRANMATTLGLLGRHDESAALLREILSDEQAQHNSELLREAHDKVIESEANAEERSK